LRGILKCMRTHKFTFLTGLLLAVICLGAHAAADGDAYLGKWNGTFAGDNTSGRFELTLERGGDGVLTGTIAVSPDGDGSGDYTAKLKTASFAGDHFTAIYEPPGDGQTEINLKGAFNPKSGDGDWSITVKAQPTAPAVATGTWKITKG
jgi:hypothetical protein